MEWAERGCGRRLHEECNDCTIQDADGKERLFFVSFVYCDTALYMYLPVLTTNLLMNFFDAIFHSEEPKKFRIDAHKMKAHSISCVNICMDICA